MAASLVFYSTDGYLIDHSAGSGLGFFGENGFGASVAVGEYNDTTFITDSNGSVQGQQIDNNKWVSTSGVNWGGGAGSGYLLTELPNDLATLNVRFTNDSGVQIQNAELFAYDADVSVTTPPDGLTVNVAEIIHTNTTPGHNPQGSGDTLWNEPSGSAEAMGLSDSPGNSGYFAISGITGTAAKDTQHDWYAAVSVKPLSVGAKTGNKIRVSVEYL